MTVKAGQKCTAIRRALVPAALADQVTEAARDRLAKVVVGNPAEEGVRMGALAGLEQREEVRRSVKALLSAGRIVSGDPDHVDVVGGQRRARRVHVPATAAGRRRGPPRAASGGGVRAGQHDHRLRDTAEVIELAARGRGSLVGSVVTADVSFARDVVLGLAPWHGRVLVLDREDGAESTGHGSPLPHAGARRPGPGRRRRGDGRRPWRAAPHAAHGRAGQPAGALGRHPPLDPGYRTECRWRPPLPQVARRSAHRRHGGSRTA